MGNQITTVVKKIDSLPPKCLEVNIDVRRGTPERFFLIPVTPTTMPTPQSPLCAMLNEALSAPSAVHWAWPPVSNIETPFTGVADARLALTEASRAVPSVEQTFAHALPRQGSGRQDKGEGHAAAVELGHLLSFVAVECPVDCPNSGEKPFQNRGDRAAPQGQGEGTSIFFDFSAEWLESIAQTEGCTVVGYFRYLNLFDLPNTGALSMIAAAATRGTAPMVSVIDHYLFKGFCYEARAFMLLESVSFYCKRFASLYADRTWGIAPKRSGRHRALPPGAAFPILMRCRSMSLPILRLFQKLYRVHVREGSSHHQRGVVEAEQAVHLENNSRSGAQHSFSPIRLMECGDGEILHVYLSPEVGHHIATKLSDKISFQGKGVDAVCTVKFEKGLPRPTPTPFDAFIERHRERWLVENRPFRKNKSQSVGSDGEGPEEETGHQGRHRALPLPVPSRLRLMNVGDARDSPSSLSSADVSPSSIIRGALVVSVGCNDTYSAPASVGPEGWESSGTSLETLVAPLRSPKRMGFLEVGTPIQINCGDGQWICGYWLEASSQLTPHWFDPPRSENALLQHYGPIWIRDLSGGNRLIEPTSTGKVYVAVTPYVRVFSSPNPEAESVEVRTMFERNNRTVLH